MTEEQKATLRLYLKMFLDIFGPEFRHGVCEGSDLQASEIAVSLGYHESRFPAGDKPLVRNRLIVDGSILMFATPHQNREVLRSGTWATIRYTNRMNVPGITIWPNGSSTPMALKVQP